VNAVASLGGHGSAGAAADGRSLAEATGQLWASGVAVDWAALSQGRRRRRVPLPAYPYERTRYWVESAPSAQSAPTPVMARSSALEANEADAIPRITYLPAWRQRRLPSVPDQAESGPLLVFTRGDGQVEEAAGELARRGRTVIRVVAGDGFADLGDGTFQITPDSRGDYDSLLGALHAGAGCPSTVLHGWTATPARDAGSGTAAVHAVRDTGFFSLLFLTQAYTTRWPGAELAVRVVTTYGANVSGTEAIEPAKALLHGPCKVLPIEVGQITCQLIDMSPATGADQLLREMAAPVTDQTVAYRGDRRWVADYELTSALAEPVTMPLGLRRRGVYLITGGLGDIGLRVARRLVDSVGARLILTSRTRLPDQAGWDDYLAANGNDKVSARIRAVRELEGLGSEVLAVCADVTDEQAMRMVADAAVERFGRIDGVFHLAGVPGAGVMAMKSRERAESVLSPKVDGTLVLDRVLGDDISLMVLFSSIFAVTGMYGQVDYCAANAFVDAFAQARAGGRVQVVSVDWCGWTGLGMVSDGAYAETEAGAAPPAAGDGMAVASGAAEAIPAQVRLGDEAPGLLGRRVLDTDDVAFASVVGPGSHWVLADHQMADRQVFPGTSYAEMIAAAAREAFGGGAVELRDLIFGRLLAIDGLRDMRVTGTRQEPDAYHFTVTSRPAGDEEAIWERHASATATAYRGGQPPWQDVAAIAKRCDLLHWKPTLTKTGQVVVFGPHWEVVQAVALGQGEQLATLELPAGLDTDLAEFSLHPSLLDGATALSLYVPESAGGGRSFLPMAYDRIVVRDALPARFYSYIRNRDNVGGSGILSYDISLLDDDGRELVLIEGFSVRVVDVKTVHEDLDAVTAKPERRASRRIGLTMDEITLEPEFALDILWRILDTRQEPQYVVTPEPVGDRMKRVAGLADQITAVIGSARGGALAGAATVLPAALARSDTEPLTPAEKTLLSLWEDAFAVSQLGLDVDFLDLGGNSLVAVQLAVRIRERFKVNVPGVAMLEYSTVRMLAEFIDNLVAQAAKA